MTAHHSADAGYSHHVIGAVHEVTIELDDPQALVRAVEHELIECEAMRIVVDLTELVQVTDAHLEALRPLALDADRAAVRLGRQAADRIGAALDGIGLGDVITEDPPSQAGRNGLPDQPQG
jgi:hypothetical protein